jgi:hypothetical protein
MEKVMTNQREAFEKWFKNNWGEGYYPTPLMYEAWQAAQADQAEYIVMLELNNKFKDERNAQLQTKVTELDGKLGARNLNKEAEYLTKLTQLQLDNEKLRDLLSDLHIQADYYHMDGGYKLRDKIDEALSTTTQPKSTVLNYQTVQKPLSGMKILELSDEYRLDAIMSDAINFARAIEKLHGIGE